MEALKAMRIKVILGDLWESPPLHVLLTLEDSVYVCRCLDFLVASHGDREDEAIESLAGAMKEYILTVAENDAWDTLFDPARKKYWRLFNLLESRQMSVHMKKVFSKKPVDSWLPARIPVELRYA